MLTYRMSLCIVAASAQVDSGDDSTPPNQWSAASICETDPDTDAEASADR